MSIAIITLNYINKMLAKYTEIIYIILLISNVKYLRKTLTFKMRFLNCR